MANATHELVTITYTLDAAPSGSQTLGVVLWIATDLDLNGADDRTKTYASKAALTADYATDGLTAAQYADLAIAFDQLPTPAYVRIGNRDLANDSETYATAYTAIAAETDDFFYVTCDSRTTSEQLVLAAILASDPKICIVQSSASACLGNEATFEAEFTNTTQENFVVMYHPTDGEALDIGYACARGNFDPDIKSVGWQGVVRSVAAYPSGSVSTSQRDTVKTLGRVNLLLDAGPQSNYVSPGRTTAGRQIKQMVSVFWYLVRLGEDLINLKLDADAAGDVIPVDEDGQHILRMAIQGRYDLGVSARHFKAGQLVLEFPDPISSSDIDAGILRTSNHRITTTTNAEEFIIGVNFTNNDVNVTLEEAE